MRVARCDPPDYAPSMSQSHHGLSLISSARPSARIARLALLLALPLCLTACPDDAMSVETESQSSTTTGEAPTTSISPTTTMPAESSESSAGSSGSSQSSGADTTAGSSSTGPAPTCGDGVADEGEQCDGDDLAGQDCASQGFFGGELRCSEGCTFDTFLCEPECGNGDLERGEVCDGDQLGGEDCVSQGFEGGELVCGFECNFFDTSSCFACGDGAINGPDVCDGVALGGESCVSQGFDGGNFSCLPDCSGFDTSGCFACGNGIVEDGEVCDIVDVIACADVGLGGAGNLSCAADCSGYLGCDPPAGYGDCVNFDPALVCAPDEICGTDGGMPPSGACLEQGCVDAGDCPAAPPTGTATPSCQDVTSDGINDCWLSCSGGAICPDGMSCFVGLVCVWPS